MGVVSMLLLLVAASGQAQAVRRVENRTAMGSPFRITGVGETEKQVRQGMTLAWQEIDRLEALISSWRADSETSRVNRAAGQSPVQVSSETFGLLSRSLKVAGLSGGAFDPTFGPLADLWDLKAVSPKIPAAEKIEEALTRVGWEKVELDRERRTVLLAKPGMRIGFGGIGKGLAANRALWVLRERGLSGGLVDAGGDLAAFGRDLDGESWQVVVAHPRFPEKVFARLRLTDQAVVTSGDYERFVMIEGRRYGHILDPRSGWPASGLISSTVVCPDAELADALATAVFVLGPEEGIALLDRLKDVEGLLVDDDGQVILSKGFRELARWGSESP